MPDAPREHHQEGSDDRLERLSRWFRRHWPEIVLLVSGASGTSAGFFKDEDYWQDELLMTIAVIGGLVGGLSVLRRKPTFLQMEDQVSALEARLAGQTGLMRDVHRSMLADISDALDFGTSERLSVYVSDGQNKSFQLLARQSRNPVLEQRGRPAYPHDEGVIAKAWAQEWFCQTDLPDPGDVTYEGAAFAQFDIPPEVGRELKMKPRSIAGFRYPRADLSRKPLGVLILESNNPRGVNNSMRQTLENTDRWRALEEHLHENRGTLPVLSVAREAGF